MRSAKSFVSTLCLLALLGACGAEPTREDAPSRPAAGAPGIVVLCLDTLRADALDPAHAARMPALTAFARGAAAFSDASSTAAWTPPAIASVLTGLGPARHGVGALGAGVLPSTVTTLAESLRAAGWSTAAVTGGGWVSAGTGFRRGFDRFHPTFDEIGPQAAVRAWEALRPANRPFFLFLHTYAPHDPYGEKRPGLVDRDPRGRVAIELEVERVLAMAAARGTAEPLDAPTLRRVAEASRCDPAVHHALLAGAPPEVQQPIGMQVRRWCEEGWRAESDARGIAGRMRAAYDAGLAWADTIFARTMAALEEARLPEGTAIVVLGDHGEAFGEHGVLGHGSTLYDEIVRVPLLIAAPGRLAPGVYPGSCSLADVMPTLLELAHLPAAGDIDGHSLLPLVRGDDPGWPVIARAETPVLRSGATVTARYESVRTRAAKYLVTYDPYTREVVKEELFDLAVDPAEATPLAPTGLGRFGDRFCAACGRVRADLVFPATLEPACGAVLR